MNFLAYLFKCLGLVFGGYMSGHYEGPRQDINTGAIFLAAIFCTFFITYIILIIISKRNASPIAWLSSFIISLVVTAILLALFCIITIIVEAALQWKIMLFKGMEFYMKLGIFVAKDDLVELFQKNFPRFVLHSR